MFELNVESEFCAAHAIAIAGQREPTHGHNWRVTAVVRGGTLDDDGLLCDFHELQRALEAVLAPLRDGDLNATPPFDEINPTAENVARHIAAGLSQRLAGRASIARVTVTEAPGCAATYIVAR